MNTNPLKPVLIKRPRKVMARAVSAALVASAATAPALAQSLEEVLVTATKRSESVQDVPIAITALSGAFVNKVNLDDVKDLVSFTPGVTGNSQDSFIDVISVRGIRTQDFGVGGDPSAAFFKNDLYEGRNGAVVSSLYDIDHVEILRGPQGFLFGRNSIGGAFSVHTQRAEIGDANTGYIDLDVAERGRYVAEGAVNIPVSENYATRIAAYYSTEDGFAKNRFPGSNQDLIEHEKWALRWSNTYETEKLAVYTTAEYEDRKQSGSLYRAVDSGDIWETLDTALGGISLRGDDEEFDSDQSAGDADDGEILTLGLRVDYDLDFATLTSNTGYKDHDYYYLEDYDGTPLVINNFGLDQTGEYFQQELRLTSDDDAPLSWYAGVSYYKEELESAFLNQGSEDAFCQYYGYYYNNYYYNDGATFSGCVDYYGSSFMPSVSGLLNERGFIDGEYSGWAGYINLAYEISDRLEVEVGARYTDDEKDFSINVPTPESDLGPYWAYGFSTDGPISAKQSWDEVTSRYLLRWRPSDDAMLYASFTEGFKAGGFGSFSMGSDDPDSPAIGNVDITPGQGFSPDEFDPETVDSYEIGYKDTLFDGATNIDLTAFYYEYEDLQVIVSTESGAAVVRNAGRVEAWGVEGSLTTRLNDNFTAYLTVGYLDSEATGLAGNPATGEGPVCGLDDPLGCEGSSTYWAPDWSGAFVLDANFPCDDGALTGSFQMFFESERGGGWEDLEETKISSYAELALRLGYASNDNWKAELYVENLTDEFTWDGQNNGTGIQPDQFFGPKRPRTFGVRWAMEFN